MGKNKEYPEIPQNPYYQAPESGYSDVLQNTALQAQAHQRRKEAPSLRADNRYSSPDQRRTRVPLGDLLNPSDRVSGQEFRQLGADNRYISPYQGTGVSFDALVDASNRAHEQDFPTSEGEAKQKDYRGSARALRLYLDERKGIVVPGQILSKGKMVYSESSIPLILEYAQQVAKETGSGVVVDGNMAQNAEAYGRDPKGYVSDKERPSKPIRRTKSTNPRTVENTRLQHTYRNDGRLVRRYLESMGYKILTSKQVENPDSGRKYVKRIQKPKDFFEEAQEMERERRKTPDLQKLDAEKIIALAKAWDQSQW